MAYQIEPWDRQAGESMIAYEAFTTFRDLRFERGIQAVSQRLSKSRQLIHRWSAKWKWEERCLAFDSWEQRELAKKNIAQRFKMQERHANLGVMAQQKFLERVSKMSPDDIAKMPLHVAARLLEIGSTIERRARGEYDEDSVAEIKLVIATRVPQTPEEAAVAQELMKAGGS